MANNKVKIVDVSGEYHILRNISSITIIDNILYLTKDGVTKNLGKITEGRIEVELSGGADIVEYPEMKSRGLINTRSYFNEDRKCSIIVEGKLPILSLKDCKVKVELYLTKIRFIDTTLAVSDSSIGEFKDYLFSVSGKYKSLCENKSIPLEKSLPVLIEISSLLDKASKHHLSLVFSKRLASLLSSVNSMISVAEKKGGNSLSSMWVHIKKFDFTLNNLLKSSAFIHLGDENYRMGCI